MKKKILPVLIIIACLLAAFAAYLFQSNNKNKPVNTFTATADTIKPDTTSKAHSQVSEEDAEEPDTVEKKEDTFTGILDMNNWKYNEKDGIYYQTDIYYAQDSLNSAYQKMALFVPEKYLRCEKHKGRMYSCVPNMASIVEKYTVRTAPIVSVISSPNYKGEPALTEYRDFKEFTDAGFIYAHIGFRGIDAEAPAAVTDIKAAIHFIKYNSERIPGNTDSIYFLAANEGSVLAAVTAASGNDRSYQPYLQQIGALNGLNDNIKGVMLVNPVSGLDTANEAVEWYFSSNRYNVVGEQKKISEKMAKEYAGYINRAGFMGYGGKALTLQYSKNGIYQDGTYYDYVKNVIEDSLITFIKRTTFPYKVPKSWEISEEKASETGSIKLTGTYQTKKKFYDDLNGQKIWIIDRSILGTYISSLKDFLNAFRLKQLPIAYYDNPKKDSKENILFDVEGKGVHFDTYTATIFKNTPQGKEMATDLYKRDIAGNTTTMRVNMYNPLYYLIPSYDGYNTSTVAPLWRIRAGLLQTQTILPTSVNLFLAVKNYPNVKYADYEAVWGMGDISGIRKKDKLEFINWVHEQ